MVVAEWVRLHPGRRLPQRTCDNGRDVHNICGVEITIFVLLPRRCFEVRNHEKLLDLTI
jgi:hypothetical protein